MEFFMTDQELKDLVASLVESGKETDRRMQETDRLMKELKDDLDKLCAQVGGIDENQGNHAEQYFQNVLAEKLIFGGQKYDRMLANLECFDKNKISQIEFDIVLVNGKSVAIIETKNRIHPKFIGNSQKRGCQSSGSFCLSFQNTKPILA
jgi:uncharacterized tellurite resistance protein B-like protein